MSKLNDILEEASDYAVAVFAGGNPEISTTIKQQIKNLMLEIVGDCYSTYDELEDAEMINKDVIIKKIGYL